MRFDFVILNPPYNQRRNNNPIHLKFVLDCMRFLNCQLVVIMPIHVAKTTSDNYDKWKEYLSNYVCSIEEIESKNFKDTKMPNVGIFIFKKNKIGNIRINLIGQKETYIDSLTLVSEHLDDYESNILSALYTEKRLPLFNLKIQGGKVSNKEDRDKLRYSYTEKLLKPYLDKWLLSVNIAGVNPRRKTDPLFFTSLNGLILFSNNTNEIYEHWCLRDVGALKFIAFDSLLCAYHCREALKRPLMRFTLLRMQDDLAMNNKCYKYVPYINWEDEKSFTDEGILELCGCSKELSIEYAEYARKIITKIDNDNKRNKK